MKLYLIIPRKDPIIKIVSKLAMLGFALFSQNLNEVTGPKILQNNRRNDQ